MRDSASRTTVDSFHAALRRRVQEAHPNLSVLLGHLQRMTENTRAEVARMSIGLRRAKKMDNLLNDARFYATRRRSLRWIARCLFRR